MRRFVLLLASVSIAVLLASRVAFAVTPIGGASGNFESDAIAAANGRDAALDRALNIGLRGTP